MDLKHIEIDKLTVSKANMRGKGRKPDIANILPSVRARGVLVPLIVRPAESGEDRFEIVAGKRRYCAALAVAEEAEGQKPEPLPCAVIEAGDDAEALEASLIENVARLDPDEVTQWECFARLVKEGRSPDRIAATFGLTERQVARTLALGNLVPRIRNLYRKDALDPASMRHLTLATKAQQREWLMLFDDDDAWCPTGFQLKAWLFGGASIATEVALFDVETFEGAIVSDLFGDERYFADVAAFWTAQNAAVEAKAAEYREAGWHEVVILPTGERFCTWEHSRVSKREGGKVFVSVAAHGEVAFHEGYLTTKEARRREQGESGDSDKPARPELTSGLANYVDLHRHAAVRNDLASAPAIALRVMVAHAIVGSPLWRVDVEPQQTRGDAIAESIETSASETAFDAKRRAVLALLDFDAECPTVTGGYDGDHGIAGLFARLLRLSDQAVLDVLAVVMAETLVAGSELVEVLGPLLGTDMAKVWQADDALLDGIRDKQVLGAILAEVAGETVAAENERATGQIKRQIVRDCLTGENGRAKVEGWVPRWMAFPASAYTARGGVPSAERGARMAELVAALAAPVDLARAA